MASQHVTLGNLIGLSVPQCPQLQHWVSNNAHLTKLQRRLNQLIYVEFKSLTIKAQNI